MVTDDFERSSLGTAWSVQPPGVAAITTGDLSSASDALMIATYIAQSFSPDQFSEAVLSPTFSNDNLRGVQVFVRRDPGTRQRYGFFVDNQTRIYTLKLDGGDPGIVLREAPGEFFRANDVIRIEAVGNLIRGIVNGVERISVRNDRLVQGQPGLVVNATAAFVPHVFAGWRGGTL